MSFDRVFVTSAVFMLALTSAACSGGDDGGSGDTGGAGTGSGATTGSGSGGSGGSGTSTGGAGSGATGGSSNLAACDECDECAMMLFNGMGDPLACEMICAQCEDGGSGGTSSSGGTGSGGSGSGGTGGNHIPENDCITAQVCNFNSDCSNGYHCNSAVNQCFDPEPVASSVLSCDVVPCQFNSDCPAPWQCSTATDRCFLP